MNTNLLKSIFISLILVMGVTQIGAANITSDGTARLYFNMSAVSWWTAGTDGNGNFGYFFNNSTGKNAWSTHAVKYSGDVYYLTIPQGTWAGVILTRNNTSTSPSWSNKWNQTGDITLSNTSNYISKFSEGSTSVTWGSQKPTSAASVTASSTNILINEEVTLSAALTSNTELNKVASTTYSTTGGTITEDKFTASVAGTYTVTAKITYHPNCYSNITSTVEPTVTITVTLPETKHDVTVSYKYNDVELATATTSKVGEVTASPISAPATINDRYAFHSWDLGSGIQSDDDTTANPINVTTLASGDYTMTANYKDTYTTIYFVNSKSWSSVNAYTWVGETPYKSWPGEAMTKTEETVNGFDVYSYSFPDKYTNCIFNGNGQTSDLTVTAGQYYDMASGNWYASLTEVPTPDPLATDVYLVGEMNSWNPSVNSFRKEAEGATTASVTVTLEAKNYQFKIIDGDWLGNKGTMKRGGNSVHEGGWTFEKLEGGNETNCKIEADIAGEYTFTWDIKNKKLTVTYPPILSYRLVYVEGTASSYTKFHPSKSIDYVNEEKRDTVSFYINKEAGDNPTILLQQGKTNIVGGSTTWENLASLSINGLHGDNPGGALAPAKRSAELNIGSGCPVVTENGVYNFVLQQIDGVATILKEETHPYVGNYYIRTDAAEGGWDKYKTHEDNIMTHSETALMHGGYDYYFCKWIESVSSNIKYTVANDYSLCVSDTLDGDAIAPQGSLPAQANVRFTWNSKKNALKRAYLSGSGDVSQRFLVLEGDEHLTDVNGNPFKVSGLNNNEAIFKDMEDWQYQVDVKADNNTKVKLTAKYNNQVQYFKGSATEKVQILEGGTRAYKIRLIYDFKTNYIITALIDDEPITEDITFEEVMIIREHHKPAQSLNITTGSITGIKNLYAVMTFYKDQLNDGSKSQYERALYWVSFPFDVKLDEAFGSGNYGDHWIMEYYDGAERAEKGLWADAGTYWKYITDPTDFILKAGVGYVLCLDLDKLGNLSPVYGKSDHISIYFPSAADISTISLQELKPVNVPAHECEIDQSNNGAKPERDRRIKDSNWNIIGVPSYANANLKHGARFYYNWNPADNSYQTNESATNTTFNTMHAYMVQYEGTINWAEGTVPQAIAAHKSVSTKDQYTLRLALQQEGTDYDHTFIRLQEDNATAEFDMNYDLCKIINSGANIYSMIGNVEVAANVLPMEERVIPIGLDIHETGNYTFAMPNGTDGITAILIDYETGKETNLLLADYTTELREGTNNGRFALRVRPNHVATAVETIIDGANGQIQKYIINGALYILNNGQLYDAQGRMVQP